MGLQGTQPGPSRQHPIRPLSAGRKGSSTICCCIIKSQVYKSKPICCQTNRQIVLLLKGVEAGEASVSSPPCLLDEEEYEAGPIFRDNKIQALCLAPLPRWSSWKQGPGRPEAAWFLSAPLDSSPGFCQHSLWSLPLFFLDSEKVLRFPLK